MKKIVSRVFSSPSYEDQLLVLYAKSFTLKRSMSVISPKSKESVHVIWALYTLKGKVKFQAGMITVRDIVGIFAGLETSIKPGRRISMSFGSIPSIAILTNLPGPNPSFRSTLLPT